MRVRDNQQLVKSRQSKCNIPFFIHGMTGISKGDGKRIPENSCCLWKSDTMHFFIGVSLR